MKKYAITISPPYSKDRPSFKYNSDKPIIIKYLNKVSDYYILYPELSTDGRLHYHGIIQFRDMIKWYKSTKHILSSLLGFICLKIIKTNIDNIKWIYYISKDWPITKGVLDIQDPLIIKTSNRNNIKKIKKNQKILDNIITRMLDHDIGVGGEYSNSTKVDFQ